MIQVSDGITIPVCTPMLILDLSLKTFHMMMPTCHLLLSAHVDAVASVARLGSCLEIFNQKSSPSVLGKRRGDLEDDIQNLRTQKCCLQNNALHQFIALEEQKMSITSKIHLLQAEYEDL
jgi:hypothetical protein